MKNLILLFLFTACSNQEKNIYLFYLHGGIVQDMGPNAVSEYYGAYDYFGILDSLRTISSNLISELRPKGTEVSDYVNRIIFQLDSLQQLGVHSDQIVIIGASLGAYIAVEVSAKRQDKDLNFVIQGLCSDYSIGYYQPIKKNLRGHFLSIYEESDQKKSCDSLFQEIGLSSYKEIKLQMGNSHGFLFKPYTEWLDPLRFWINKRMGD